MDINANEQININMAVQNTLPITGKHYIILFISCNLSNGYTILMLIQNNREYFL